MESGLSSSMLRMHLSGMFGALRIGSASLICGTVALILWAVGYVPAAGGMMIGSALYAGNAFLLVETGRSLLLGGRSGRVSATVSAAGRILLLGVLLAAIFLFLGKPVGLGACGGLFISQVNLALPIRRTGVET